MMTFLLIVIVVIVGIIVFISSQNNKQRQAIIDRRKNFVLSFMPNARIIVNNGTHLFFMDDEKQVFGTDDSRTTYSYSGLHCISEHKNYISMYHNNVPFPGLYIGHHSAFNETAPVLDSISASAIMNEMLPILRNNLHDKLSNLNIAPTHEYVVGGIIWGCDIHSKMFYNTHAYFQIYPFSKLVNVTMEDWSHNPNYLGYKYAINVTIKSDDGQEDDELRIPIDDQTTLNNLLAMFKGIKDRQNKYDIRTDQRNFDLMEGHEFERFCAELLRKNGYQHVSVTQGSGDQGIDIIAYRDGIKYGIQCKCYSSDIGNKAVQEVFAGKAYYECHIGVVLTNQFFTKSAVELAKKNGIILWDRNKLLELIQNA